MTIKKKAKRRSFHVDFTRVRVGRRKPRRVWPPSRRYLDHDMEYWRELDELTADEHHYGWGKD